MRNEAFGFINTNITAEQIGQAYIGYPKYSNIIENEHTIFGVIAGSIDKFTLKDSSQKTTWIDMTEPNDTKQFGDFEININPD